MYPRRGKEVVVVAYGYGVSIGRGERMIDIYINKKKIANIWFPEESHQVTNRSGDRCTQSIFIPVKGG